MRLILWVAVFLWLMPGRAADDSQPPADPVHRQANRSLAALDFNRDLSPILSRRWIEQGANYETHWAFVSPPDPPPPQVADARWAQQPLDLFVLAGLEAVGLRPAPCADRRTLLRRASFDLIGLPPTPEQVAAFLADTSPEAFARVVESLLASPRYGERWGRHWLDVARYGDSNGGDENHFYPHAFRYRNYVIDAFNRDLPYDRFLLEQVAGDLLPPTADLGEQAKRVTATGFLAIGTKILAEKDPVKMRADIVDEQIDTFGRALIGLTLGCARCHDHKFDPIPTKDYYALAGIFHSTSLTDQPLETEAYQVAMAAHQSQIKDLESEVAETDRRVRDLLDERARVESKPNRAQIDKILEPPAASAAVLSEASTRARVLAAKLSVLRTNAPQPEIIMAVKDGKVGDAKIHLRGSHTSLGALVPRGFLSQIGNDGRPLLGQDRSGRLELARWLTRPDHPLTSRVMVNRIWRWHFGKGIVGSTDNFGTKGQRPTHLDLLNHLAWRFIEDGWSPKAMHRRIMLSSTYQMVSVVRDREAERVDPANTLYWKRDVIRLEAEAFRDAVLQLAGGLDFRMDGAPPRVKSADPSPEDLERNRKVYEQSPRRTVYLPVVRSNVYDLLTLLDFPNASTPDGSRATTTVPTQALLMMNNPGLIEQAGRLMAIVLRNPRFGTDRARLNALYEKLFSRPATGQELDWGLSFLKSYGADEAGAVGVGDSDIAWVALGQTLLISNEFVHNW